MNERVAGAPRGSSRKIRELLVGGGVEDGRAGNENKKTELCMSGDP